MASPIIHRVTTLDLAVRPIVWPFAEERGAEIAAHFAEKQRERPKIWNGRVLLGQDAVFADGHLSATYFETDFASFLAWRDWGFPDKAVFNGFGMGALRASDGAFIMGEMAQHTANAGRIYFPSGTPDLDDVIEGALDIPGSVVREIEEETGLTAADYRAEPDWHCIVSGPAIAMMQVLNLDMPGDEARALIEANLAREDEPELSAIHLVRGMSDLTPTMPRFVTAFIEQQFASR
ncbi:MULTISPECIES: NUDIX hydrolase [unclassified Bradyrhizobium]|uniref:NUDIX hydrolase n=1 Tax=unclassified Bradyrhizobium TaxID=2631580 RepID=UPI001FF1EA48|nr:MULTISPECIES: NUDIX hydrolase [unclassified Bradyrhizobium]MCJ9704991.1 NUDIX hydrolase [Bradyrhizobium sp. SHOUNA76]MCJ9733623.1 NUDIX hydrolase [Bradyrhizobium sp. PRIMUS42]